MPSVIDDKGAAGSEGDNYVHDPRQLRLLTGHGMDAVDHACVVLEHSKSATDLVANWRGFLAAVNNPVELDGRPLHLAAEHLQVLIMNPQCFLGDEANEESKRGAVLIISALQQLIAVDPRVTGVLEYLQRRTGSPTVREQVESIIGSK